MSRSTGVSRDGLSRLSMMVEKIVSERVSELSRLSMRIEEMVSGSVSGNSDTLSNTGVNVVSSCFFVFLFGSFLMSLVWNCF